MIEYQLFEYKSESDAVKKGKPIPFSCLRERDFFAIQTQLLHQLVNLLKNNKLW